MINAGLCGCDWANAPGYIVGEGSRRYGAFAMEGKILWTTGLVLAVGHALGGWYASRWSVSAGEVWIKRVMVGSIVAMAIKLWFWG